MNTDYSKSSLYSAEEGIMRSGENVIHRDVENPTVNTEELSRNQRFTIQRKSKEYIMLPKQDVEDYQTKIETLTRENESLNKYIKKSKRYTNTIRLKNRKQKDSIRILCKFADRFKNILLGTIFTLLVTIISLLTISDNKMHILIILITLLSATIVIFIILFLFLYSYIHGTQKEGLDKQNV